MGDINQEWKELRMKNGNFINHLDGEIAKIEKEKKQVELKKAELLQDLTDAGAFTMQFVAPPPFNCCQDDRDILKALNKAQADRIEHLEDEIVAYKKQQDVDLAIKKDLDEKLDKATADYRALWVKNEDLKHQLAGAKAQCENTVENRRRISELSQEVINLREQQKNAAKSYARLATERNNLAETVSKMQSNIAKQAAEIKRLTEENKQLHNALDIAAKDADANFERGMIKGMEKIWNELKDAYANRTLTENKKIFGYATVGDIVDNLSPTWFINKAEEYHEQQAKDIQIGDEVEIFDEFCPDDDPHSDIGIVIAIDKDHPCFAVIGPNFESCFDETDIEDGNVRKTGQHFDSIPLAYFA